MKKRAAHGRGTVGEAETMRVTKGNENVFVDCGSDLMRGKIGLFTIDTLVNMATAAGVRRH